MALLREKAPHLWRSVDLEKARTGERVVIGGMVICRQRPGSAKGFVFVSLEDESGVANAIVTPRLYEQCRLVIGEESFLAVEGIVQNVERVIHVKAERITQWIATTIAENDAGHRMSVRRLRCSIEVGRVLTSEELQADPADAGIVNRLIGWWGRMRAEGSPGFLHLRLLRLTQARTYG